MSVSFGWPVDRLGVLGSQPLKGIVTTGREGSSLQDVGWHSPAFRSEQQERVIVCGAMLYNLTLDMKRTKRGR